MPEAKAISAVITDNIDLGAIPAGNYPGAWGGYVVTATIQGKGYRFAMDTGIRTPRAECTVTVAEGRVTVTTNE